MQCKSFSHFFNKNISVFGCKVEKLLTSWPLYELVKLTMLWTTGPRCSSNFQDIVVTIWHGSHFIGVMVGPFFPELRPSVSLPHSCRCNFCFRFQPVLNEVLGYICHYMMWIIFYWDHDLTFNAKVTALYRSGQILWQQLLQFSADFHQTFRMGCILSVSWLNFFAGVTVLYKLCNILWPQFLLVFNQFSSKFQDILITNWHWSYQNLDQDWVLFVKVTTRRKPGQMLLQQSHLQFLTCSCSSFQNQNPFYWHVHYVVGPLALYLQRQITSDFLLASPYE